MSDEIMINQLEEWRKRHGLKKTDMARILKLNNPQTYTNWIGRRSLPKEYYLLFFAVVNADDPKEAELMVKSAITASRKGSPLFETMTQVASENPEKYGVIEPVNVVADVPLISRVQAGEWDEANDQYEPGYAEQYLFCNRPHSNKTFALRVDGDSMTSPSGRTYPTGTIIYVDPEQRGGVVPGDPVVAKLVGEDMVTFKQLAQDRQGLYLKPLNPTHEPIYGEFRVLGKVILAELPW